MIYIYYMYIINGYKFTMRVYFIVIGGEWGVLHFYIFLLS